MHGCHSTAQHGCHSIAQHGYHSTASVSSHTCHTTPFTQKSKLLSLVKSLNNIGVTYYFACHRWLSRDEDDGLIERDLFPGDHKDPSPDMHYMAEVFTSDVRGAGTDADVSMELFGHMGSSGLQRLNVGGQAACYANG